MKSPRCLISLHSTHFNPQELQENSPEDAGTTPPPPPRPRNGRPLLGVGEGGLTVGLDLSRGRGKDAKSVFSTRKETGNILCFCFLESVTDNGGTWWNSEGRGGVLDPVPPIARFIDRFLWLFLPSRALLQPSLPVY